MSLLNQSLDELNVVDTSRISISKDAQEASASTLPHVSQVLRFDPPLSLVPSSYDNDTPHVEHDQLVPLESNLSEGSSPPSLNPSALPQGEPMPTMSYPPSADHSIPTRRGAAARNSRPLSATSDMSFYPEESDAGNHSLSRSSADMYAQVPTSDGPAWDPTSPALYPLDSPDPNSPRPYGHSSPYDRSYSDNNMSGHGSTMNLSDDGDSQRNIYARGAMPRTASNLQYHDEPSEEVLASRVGVPTASEKARVNSSTRRSAMAGASAKGKPKGGFWSRLSSRARKFVIVGGILAIILIAVVVAVPAALLGHGKSNASAADTTSGAASTTVSAPSGVPTGVNGANWKTAAVGGDGSLVYLDDGSSFVYNNTFGGFWNAIPFNDSAQAQADVPPLNEPWDYSNARIQGVNIGGWLLLEPFISPTLFEPFNSDTNDPNATNLAVDEWTLCVALGTNMSAVITEHYDTFITEKDFAEIAGAGLNWVRLPLPYWAIEVYDGEPFLGNVGWSYFLKAIEWARKYGLRINLDLHAVPGSQNGYNHSSKLGTINFLNGVMGVANAQRTLNYIRTLAEFISQPQYSNVVPMFSVLNEPYAATITVEVLRQFYLETYNMVRGISGIGEGNGPFITFHDGFVAQATNISQGSWDGFLPGADRMALDQHPYLCFDASGPNNDGLSYQAAKPCAYWATKFNTSAQQFGLSMGGEWALATNDCGKWINNVGNGARYDGTYYALPNTTAPVFKSVGSCDQWNDWESYNASIKAGLQQVGQGHMDALRNWFFWTWKTGRSTTMGKIANPLWNYQLALQQGYINPNPRLSLGVCTAFVAEQGVSMSANPVPSLSAWMTGGTGAGTILATDQLTSYGVWPPLTIGTLPATPASNLPTYTPTGAIDTMSVATPTSFPSGYASVTNVGDGWEQTTDTAGWFTPVAGCSYPNPWSGVEATIPAAVCTGSAAAAKREVRKEVRREGRPTPVPTGRYRAV